MSRVYNFSAGPAILPQSVLEIARDEMLEWQNSGMSVCEMSHRGKDYLSIAQTATQDLCEILSIPESYRVLFLQGGASSQFAMVPLNLIEANGCADYIVTGSWGKKALKEARRFNYINVAGNSASSGYTTIPSQAELTLNSDAAYVHITANETIEGVEFHNLPDVKKVPLVADMSSTLLSRPIDINRFGLIYAGAQKNFGPAGLTVVILHEDLLTELKDHVPSMLGYRTHADADSMYNTPPAYAWYMAGLVFKWIKENGGLTRMAEINQRKATKLYTAIDRSDFYKNNVARSCRSWMNIPFTLAQPELDNQFLSQAKSHNLTTLAGHRSVGGMRASLYNAMPEAGVDALVEFMREFERTNG